MDYMVRFSETYGYTEVKAMQHRKSEATERLINRKGPSVGFSESSRMTEISCENTQ
jgi:hypothetical protein